MKDRGPRLLIAYTAGAVGAAWAASAPALSTATGLTPMALWASACAVMGTISTIGIVRARRRLAAVERATS